MSSFLDNLLNQTPDQAQAWVTQVISGQITANDHYNEWLGFAESAGRRANAQFELDANERIQWAAVAISVYDYLAAAPNATGMHFREFSAMVLRASMIRTFGALAGHFVLDPSTLEKWFFEHLTLSLDEAMKMADNKANLSDQEVRLLSRNIGNLPPLELLLAEGYFQDNEQLHQWLQVKDKLRR